MGEAVVYRAYDADDRLLYVGCSCDLSVRKAGHRSKSKWFRDAVRWEVETFPSLRLAEKAELKAIRTEGPLHNHVGVKTGSCLDRGMMSLRAYDEARSAWMRKRDQALAAGRKPPAKPAYLERYEIRRMCGL